MEIPVPIVVLRQGLPMGNFNFHTVSIFMKFMVVPDSTTAENSTFSLESKVTGAIKYACSLSSFQMVEHPPLGPPGRGGGIGKVSLVCCYEMRWAFAGYHPVDLQVLHLVAV